MLPPAHLAGPAYVVLAADGRLLHCTPAMEHLLEDEPCRDDLLAFARHRIHDLEDTLALGIRTAIQADLEGARAHYALTLRPVVLDGDRSIVVVTIEAAVPVAGRTAPSRPRLGRVPTAALDPEAMPAARTSDRPGSQ